MVEKIIGVTPGKNRFKVVGVQQFGTVRPLEYTETGWPKNTTTDFMIISIDFDPIKKTCEIKIGEKEATR